MSLSILYDDVPQYHDTREGCRYQGGSRGIYASSLKRCTRSRLMRRGEGVGSASITDAPET